MLNDRAGRREAGAFCPDRSTERQIREGPVEVQAQNDSMRLFAEKKLTLSSASDISFAGKKRITLIAGELPAAGGVGK
ncbi:VGR-related protein [Escherichia coli]|uniref:VGR-related protein n=1 Tax=Escherichia coli TaxID=562 RepID=A0A376KWD6_ECOLX|nr:VGR-related protein [Escherichia coli]